MDKSPLKIRISVLLTLYHIAIIIPKLIRSLLHQRAGESDALQLGVLQAHIEAVFRRQPPRDVTRVFAFQNHGGLLPGRISHEEVVGSVSGKRPPGYTVPVSGKQRDVGVVANLDNRFKS